MYHVSRDKRSARSAELIYQGVLACLAHKAFDQITVTDLQRATGVARSTFYRCFDNLSDVLCWRCEQCFSEALRDAPPGTRPDEQALIGHYFSYWMTHFDILDLLTRIDRRDILYAAHLKRAEELARDFGSLPGMDGNAARYFLAICTGVTIGVLQAWLDGGKKESAEELLRIVRAQCGRFG